MKQKGLRLYHIRPYFLQVTLGDEQTKAVSMKLTGVTIQMEKLSNLTLLIHTCMYVAY